MSLTYEEKIKRIEMAPKEVQTMVAKAFIREDIEDESVYKIKRQIWFGLLNVFVAFVESYIINILFDALLLATGAYHQNIVGVNHDVIA